MSEKARKWEHTVHHEGGCVKMFSLLSDEELHARGLTGYGSVGPVLYTTDDYPQALMSLASDHKGSPPGRRRWIESARITPEEDAQ